jgi:hypothetical protein
MADRLADAFVATAQSIRNGTITPEGVAAEISEFTPERQLAKVYDRHRRLQRLRFAGDAQSRALGGTRRRVA